jgi:hypothetical protein
MNTAQAAPVHLTDDEYTIADAIEAAFETKPASHTWTYSELAGKTGCHDRGALGRVLRYMVANRYAKSNGRGGCWERFSDARYRPHN